LTEANAAMTTDDRRPSKAYGQLTVQVPSPADLLVQNGSATSRGSARMRLGRGASAC